MGVRQQSWEKVATAAKSLMKRCLQAGLVSQPAEGGLGHRWGQTVTITPPCSLAVPHLQEAKCIITEGGKWPVLPDWEANRRSDHVPLAWLPASQAQ